MPIPVSVIGSDPQQPPWTYDAPGPTVVEALAQALRAFHGVPDQSSRHVYRDLPGLLLICDGAMYRVWMGGFRRVANDLFPHKGFTQLTLTDLLQDPEYWIAHFERAESQGVIFPEVKAALFPMVVEAWRRSLDANEHCEGTSHALKIPQV